MNKEEFYNIVHTELDKLLEEKKKVLEVLNYYDVINDDGSYDNDYFYHEQRKQPEYKLKLCEAKIEKVKELLGYPLYVRISSMSDLELEEYKKQSIEELVSKINELKKEIEYEENEINELKNRQKQIISKLSSTSDKEREEARIEAKEIFRALKDYNRPSVEGTFEEQIQELEKQIELLNTKTPDEIRNELLSRVPNNGIHINTATRYNDDYSNFVAVADTAEDYDKTEKIIDLTLKKENIKQDSSNRINSSNDYQEINSIIDKLPESFKYGLSLNLNKYKLDKDTIHKFLNDIYKFEKKCQKVEENFVDNFCINNDGTGINEDIFSLINKKQYLTDTVIPLNFFSKYEDKILSYDYANLVALFREKDELSKKVYAKFGNTKTKIQKLEQDILNLENRIFYDIRNSYIDDLSDIFDIFTPFELQISTDGSSEFFNTRHDPAVVSSMKHLFDSCDNIEDFINKVIDQFKSIKENLNKIRKILAEEKTHQKEEENEIDSINNEIKNISDVDADVLYMGSTKEEIEDFIINNAAKKKKDEVATKVEESKMERVNLEDLNSEYLEELKKLREALNEKSTQEYDNGRKLK